MNGQHDPWDISEHAFPANGSPEDKLLFLLNYAVLAPSSHNTQPWLFEAQGDRLVLKADRSRGLTVIDPADRQLVMSCGAALFHLVTAARHYKLAPIVDILPDGADPDVMAIIRIEEGFEPSLEHHRLFMAIKKRRTNRLRFRDQPVGERECSALIRAAAEEGVSLHMITRPESKQAIAQLVAEGDRIQGADPHFRRELASWIHPNRSRHRDGMPGYSIGLGDLESFAGPFVVRTFDWGEGRAARDRELADGSPALAVFVTETDSTGDWLATGRALDHVLLLAADYGIQASYLNQAIEVPHLRARLSELIDDNGLPQLLLRLGYGQPPGPTPRRPAADVTD